MQYRSINISCSERFSLRLRKSKGGGQYSVGISTQGDIKHLWMPVSSTLIFHTLKACKIGTNFIYIYRHIFHHSVAAALRDNTCCCFLILFLVVRSSCWGPYEQMAYCLNLSPTVISNHLPDLVHPPYFLTFPYLLTSFQFSRFLVKTFSYQWSEVYIVNWLVLRHSNMVLSTFRYWIPPQWVT